jgi:hypothetical protein
VPLCKPSLEKIHQVLIVDKPNVMIINLGKHEVSCERQGFGRIDPAFIDSKRRFGRVLFRREDSDLIDESVMVEFSITHPCMMRISQEIIDSINTESIAHNDFGQDTFPGREKKIAGFPNAQRELDDVFRVEWRTHRLPNGQHDVTLN